MRHSDITLNNIIMKRIILNLLSVIIAITISVPAFSQIKGNGEITKERYKVEAFDAISVGGARDVYLSQGDGYAVVVETDANIQEFVTVEVKGGTLYFGFSNKKIKKYKELNFYITAPEYSSIKASGASMVKTMDQISGDNMKISASGASDVLLNLDYNTIKTNISGASSVKLEGKAVSSAVECSGASDFIAKNLETVSTVVNASGASSCFVNAKTSLTYGVSGASDVRYVGTPETIVASKGGAKQISVNNSSTKVVSHYNDADTTKVNMGLMKVVVIDGDTTQVSVGRHTLKVSEDGDVNWERCAINKFNGHWGGVEIGINGYLTPDWSTSLAPEDDYLSLRWEKSINVNLNIFEQNIAFNKDKNIGMVTGVGLQWNNYRFSKQTYLSSDSSQLMGYYMDGISVRKTKLTAMYITIPVMFEFQTKQPRRIHRFHFAIGGQVSARISTHTKIYYNEANKPYNLVDPVTGSIVGTGLSPNSNNRNIVKNFNSFYLNPFKFDAMVRFGYGIINIYATYSLNTMFAKNKGPELYPFTAGITLVGW